MTVTSNTFAELISYLKDLKKILPSTPLNKQIYKEGTTIDQVAFHATQSVSFYLRTYVLNEEYKRDREAEYKNNHTLEEILLSINNAVAVCKNIVDKKLEITAPLLKTKTVYSRGFEITTVFEVIQHVTAHTAEHYGEIKNALSNK